MTTTNFSLLPQLSATFIICNNAGWYDVMNIPNPTGGILDLTGLDFHAELRITPLNSNLVLDMSTAGLALQSAGTLINGTTKGTLSWNVPLASMKNIPTGVYNMDILAIDTAATGDTRNMFEAGPAVVTVLQGVTR